MKTVSWDVDKSTNGFTAPDMIDFKTLQNSPEKVKLLVDQGYSQAM